MYSSMYLNQLVMADYYRARRWAFFRHLLGIITRRCTCLLLLEDVLGQAHIAGQHDAGMTNVAIRDIVGTTARSTDFDGKFLPVQEHTLFRWRSVLKAAYRGIPLPPVELMKVNDQYFVVDGHHRISVARLRGQKYIEAHVIEIEISQ